MMHASRSSRALRLPALPSTPLHRLRLMAIAVVLASGVAVLPYLLASGADSLHKVMSLVVLVGLLTYWVEGYRRGRFSVFGELLEVIALTAVGSCVDPAVFMLPLFAICFRSLYGRPSLALVRVVGYSLSLEALSAVGPELADATRAGRDIGHLVAAMAAQALVMTLRRQDLNEQTLRLYRGFKDHAVYTLDLYGRVTSWHQGAEAMLGRPADDVLGRPLAELLASTPERAEAIVHELAEAREVGSAQGSGWYHGNDGRHVYVETVTTALRDERGQLRGYARLAHDVTARMAADTALRESQERVHAVVQSSPITLWALDQDGVCTLYESGLPPLAPDGVVGHHYESGLAAWPDLIDAIRRAMAGAPAHCKVDFGVNIVECSCAPLRGEDGAIRGVIGVATDVTDRERASAQNERLEAQLIQAQRLETVGQLAGGIAHDFNNLLGIIMPYAELVLEQIEADDPIADDVQQIQKAAERAAGLTRQLLVFSRRHVVSAELLDLNEVLDDMEKLLSRTIGEDLRLVTDFQRPLWAVEADPSRVEQVLMNLAVNAREAMPDGGVLTIETANVDVDDRLRADLPSGSYVRLRVRDTGVGMEPEVAARVFEPFFTTRAGRGTGLGLATVYGIVRQADGVIAIESAPGEGTLIEVHLPATGAPVPARVPKTTRDVRLGRGERVIVIEDEEAVGESALKILERGGYRGTLVHDLRSAESALRRSGSFDLALSDVVMPDVRGPAVIAALRELQPDLPVIYMSGYAGDTDGVEPLLVKPFTAVALLERVGEELGARPQEAVPS